MKMFRMLMLAMTLTVLAILGTAFSTACAYEDSAVEITARFPQTGKKTKSDDRLSIDYSHMDEGYVMVRARKTDLRMQLTVKHGNDSVSYEINGDGDYETIPLQFGNGSYRFTLNIAQKKGSNRCVSSGSITLKCTMADELSCFLYPNQYVNYDVDSPGVKKAQELCRGLSKPRDIVRKIRSYVKMVYRKDYVKIATIRANDIMNMLPDIAAAWKTKMGVCQDVSALACAMLRSQGIPAKLAIGSADGNWHAWVVYVIDGESRMFDPLDSARNYQAERYY